MDIIEIDINVEEVIEQALIEHLSGVAKTNDDGGILVNDIGYRCDTTVYLIDGSPNNIRVEANRYNAPYFSAEYKDGKLHGKLSLYYYGDGMLDVEANYKNGELHGKIIKYDYRGRRALEVNYKDGVLHGERKCYVNGEVVRVLHFDNGKPKL